MIHVYPFQMQPQTHPVVDHVKKKKWWTVKTQTLTSLIINFFNSFLNSGQLDFQNYTFVKNSVIEHVIIHFHVTKHSVTRVQV